MAQGGARNRSGPTRDPNSARSERAGWTLAALPAEGFAGDIPKWPIDRPTGREQELWRELWRTPQACAWSLEPWRLPVVAMYCRTFARCEDHDAPASLIGQLHRFGDQIGLTTAGLREMGWAIAPPAVELAPASAEADESEAPRRLSAVPGA